MNFRWSISWNLFRYKCCASTNSNTSDIKFEIILQRQIIQVSFNLNEEAGVIETLMRRYRSVPMSFADACLVRMSEQILNSIIMTLDSDFKIYRKYRNQEIPVIMPKF